MPVLMLCGLLVAQSAEMEFRTWTSGDKTITAALKRYGGEGVPLYVVLPADQAQQPIVLSTIPSPGSLISAFEKATNAGS